MEILSKALGRRGTFNLVEGLDLSGKSTAARNFGKQNGFKYQHGLLSGPNKYKEEITRMRAEGPVDNSTTADWYIKALEDDVKRFKWPKRDTVQDSTTILRSIAYHGVTGTPGAIDRLLEIGKVHPVFDNATVLTVGRDERLRRLAERAGNGEEVTEMDSLIVRDPEKFYNMERLIVDAGKKLFGAKVLDTTNLTKEQVVNNLFTPQCDIPLMSTHSLSATANT